MRKLITTFLLTINLLILSSCSFYKELIILNWQDYLSFDLIEKFEQENNCIVTELTTTSNEAMFTDILNRKVPYDVVIPSDYMIDKLQKNNLLNEIDKDKLNYYYDEDNNPVFVKELYELMTNEKNISYLDYYVPYFWGSLCIMYSKKNFPEIEEIVQTHGFDVFFEPDLLPKGAKVAMYDSSRDSFAAAELYLGYSLNTTDEKELKECADLLKKSNFKQWKTDELKIDVASGNTDVALVYSGDFFDAYYADIEGDNPQNVETYGVYAPTKANNVFYDGMVIPVTSQEVDLAHKFIDFILNPENNYTNTEAVGYCPTTQAIFDEIFADEEGWGEIIAIDAYNPTLIINEAKEKAEVYKDLGTDGYKALESLYRYVRFN